MTYLGRYGPSGLIALSMRFPVACGLPVGEFAGGARSSGGRYEVSVKGSFREDPR